MFRIIIYRISGDLDDFHNDNDLIEQEISNSENEEVKQESVCDEEVNSCVEVMDDKNDREEEEIFLKSSEILENKGESNEIFIENTTKTENEEIDCDLIIEDQYEISEK